MAPPAGDLYRPVKELKAFGKIRLDPGQSGRVTLTLTDRSFSHWDPGTAETTNLKARMPLGNMIKKAAGSDRPAGWRIEPGIYRLHVGTSSQAIVSTVAVEIAP